MDLNVLHDLFLMELVAEQKEQLDDVQQPQVKPLAEQQPQVKPLAEQPQPQVKPLAEQQQPQRRRICLTMIVKNESAIIERALRSAAPFIDSYAICDTGSTDNTIEIIERVMGELGKPGSILKNQWVNFGHNRSEALKAARLQEPDGWAWMLDADDTLHGQPLPENFWTSCPEAINAWRIILRHGNIVHQRTQIFSNKHPWTYEGAVHEFPKCITGEVIHMLPDSVWQVARCEGARSQDEFKYVRDAFALRNELIKKPNDSRTLFYLAQSFRDAGLIQEAIKVYKERLKVDGWVQEKYICYLNLIKMTTDMTEKVAYGWAAVELDPQRCEAPYHVMLAARQQNKFSHEICAMGAIIENRNAHSNFLFTEANVYNWAFDDELSIITYWRQHHKISFEAARRAYKLAPEQHRPRILMNIKFARERLGLPITPEEEAAVAPAPAVADDKTSPNTNNISSENKENA